MKSTDNEEARRISTFLGAGTMDEAGAVRALKAGGFDSTIALEVFSPDRHYFEYSRDRLRSMWEAGD